ncbi:MAG: amidohydrolase, partial [Firmicutes bacterium]|nr:amidohydrolase [Bacillota bacterium]
MTTLLYNCTALLMDDAFTVLPRAYVAVEGSRIVSVGDSRPEGSFDREIDGGG